MATYTVLQGQTISDCILNSCGDITAWDDFLNVNFFSDWTPPLYNGQVLQIPINTNTNVGNIADLVQYPANNYSIPDIYDQINAIFLLLESAIPIPTPNATLPTIDINNYYVCRPLETVSDSILNGSGDIENWNVISQANFWDTWTPTLHADEKVAIPSTANLNLNNFRALNTYPTNNFSVADIYSQINAIFDTLNPTGNDWILFTNFWRDIGFWRDNQVWQD